MCYVVCPILIICSALIFGLVLFWYESLRAKWFYRKVKSIDQATHIQVIGLQTKGPVIVELFPGDRQHLVKDTFTFRFINF